MSQSNIADMTSNQEQAFAKHNNDRDQVEDLFNKYKSQAMTDANMDLSTTLENGESIQYLYGNFEFTGTLTASRKVILNATNHKRFMVFNNTTGGFDITVGYSAGNDATVPNGEKRILVADGTDCFEVGGSGSTDITSLSEITTIDAANDFLIVLDDTDSTNKKVKPENLPGFSGVSFVQSLDWEFIDRQVASGSAQIDFTGIDESLYDELELVGVDVTSATDATGLQVRLSAASSFLAGTNYQFVISSMNDGGGSAVESYSAGIADSRWAMTGSSGMSNVAAETTSFRLHISSMSSGLHTRGKWLTSNHASGNTEQLFAGSGRVEGSTAATDGIRIMMVSGNIATGIFILRGRRKSPIKYSASIQTTDATATDLIQIPLAAGEGAFMEAWVHGLKSTGETYSARISNAGRNNAGTTAVATQDRNEFELGTVTAGVDASIIADDTNDELTLQVTGAAAETWDWTAQVVVVKQ